MIQTKKPYSENVFFENVLNIFDKNRIELHNMVIHSKLYHIFDFADLQDKCGAFVVTLRKKRNAMGAYYNLSEGRLEEIRKDAARFNEAWTKEERDQVCQLFRDGKRVEEIAGTLHRTVNAIRIKLLDAGEINQFLSRRDQPWTEQEEERLGRFYSQGYPVAACARLLGRLLNETKDKLVEAGLLTQPEKTSRNSLYANAFSPWSEEESARLRQELSEYGNALTGIARIADGHGRSIGSIISHAVKLNLCPLPSSPDR